MSTSPFEKYLQERRARLLDQQRTLSADLAAIDKALADERSRRIRITCDTIPEDSLELSIEGNNIALTLTAAGRYTMMHLSIGGLGVRALEHWLRLNGGGD